MTQCNVSSELLLFQIYEISNNEISHQQNIYTSSERPLWERNPDWGITNVTV